MIIAHEGNAPGLDVKEPYKRTLKVLLSPLINSGPESIAAGLTIIPPGGKSDDHAHKEGEMFYVIAGRGSIRAGEEIESLIPGTAIWIPKGIRHQLINDCAKTLKILWVLSPPGRERTIIENARRN